MLILTLLLAGCPGAPRSVLFAGDSNTAWLACSYPNQWQALHDPLAYHAFNGGVFGSTATDWVASGRLLERLAADQPTEVVIALGTNDVMNRGRSGWLVVTDLLALYQQATTFTRANGEHPRVFLATTPRVYDPPASWAFTPAQVTSFNVQITALNAFLRMNVPAEHVLDFDSWMPAQWTAGMLYGPNDGVHMGCDAHTVRAQKVEAAVL